LELQSNIRRHSRNYGLQIEQLQKDGSGTQPYLSEKNCWERETVGKIKTVALVFLDLGQSVNGANPDGCEKEQPLKK